MPAELCYRTREESVPACKSMNGMHGNKGKGRNSAARGAILEAAAKLFAVKGFVGTTISDIAKESGVNRALISYHFGNKAGLYSELLESAVSSAARMIEQLSVNSTDERPEKLLIRAFATVYDAQPHLAPMLVREHLDREYFLQPENAGKLRGFIALTRKVLGSIELRPEARRYDPQIVHLICVGALIYFLITDPYRQRMQDKLDPPPTRPSTREFADVLGDFLSRALRD